MKLTKDDIIGGMDLFAFWQDRDDSDIKVISLHRLREVVEELKQRILNLNGEDEDLCYSEFCDIDDLFGEVIE